MSVEALQRAIEIVGSRKGLAQKIGASVNQIGNWLNREGRAAARFCAPIERATEGKVTCHELRPDIFPPPVLPADECDAIRNLPP